MIYYTSRQAAATCNATHKDCPACIDSQPLGERRISMHVGARHMTKSRISFRVRVDGYQHGCARRSNPLADCRTSACMQVSDVLRYPFACLCRISFSISVRVRMSDILRYPCACECLTCACECARTRATPCQRMPTSSRLYDIMGRTSDADEAMIEFRR